MAHWRSRFVFITTLYSLDFCKLTSTCVAFCILLDSLSTETIELLFLYSLITSIYSKSISIDMKSTPSSVIMLWRTIVNRQLLTDDESENAAFFFSKLRLWPPSRSHASHSHSAATFLSLSSVSGIDHVTHSCINTNIMSTVIQENVGEICRV
jgi:hypothetical protein